DTYEKDGTLDFSEDVNDRLDLTFTFIYPPPATINITQLDLFLWSSWGRPKKVETENLNILIWNFNKSRWDILPNSIAPSKKILPTNNAITENPYHYIGSYNRNNITIIRLNDTAVNAVDSTLNLDYLMLRIEYLGGAYVEDIRGGGEVHIINPLVSIVQPNLKEIGFSTWKEFLYLGTPPHMESTTYYCLPPENVTLVKEIPREICVDTICENVTIKETTACPYGCDPELNQCKPAPYLQILIIIGIAVAAFIAIKFLIIPMMR
ncbi:MAG: hypothetical protein ACUVTD_08770, partial [Nitrososphaerales archaeon]